MAEVRRDSQHNLQALVYNTLSRSPYFAGRNLDIDFQENDVILRGVVSTYYQKQLAQELVRKIEGIHQIDNQIEVISA